MMRLAAWVMLLLVGAFLLTTGGTYPGIASVEAHVIGQVVAYVVLGGWLFLALVRPTWRPSTPLFLPVLLATAAYVLAALLSQRPRLSLEPTLAGVGWALAFLFLARLLAEPWFRTRVKAVVVSLAALVAVGYIVQVVVEWITWWNLIGFLAVPPLRPSFVALWLGSPNLVATWLILTGPLAVVLLAEDPRRRPLAIALAVASLVAIFLTGSRGAWLGVMAGLLVGLVLVTFRRGPRTLLVDARDVLRRRPIILAPLGLLAIAGLALLPAALRRFTVGGEDLRLDLWRSALTIFGEHPLTGGGPGTWVQLKIAANPPGAPNLVLPHAHNMYVQAAAEVGLVGLIALLILAVAVVVRLLRGWRAAGGAGPLQSAAVLTSLAAFAGQALVDNLVNLPFVCLLLVVIVAWVDSGLSRSGTYLLEQGSRVGPALLASLHRTAVLPVLGVLAFAILLPTLLRIDRAAALALDGNGAALRGDWQVALDHFERARSMDPGFTLYDIQTAAALARVGRTAEARDLLARAVESDPVAVNVIGLAALEADLGHREAALADARRAAALGIREPVVALNAGLIAEQFGDADVALDQFANAIAWNPPLASSGLWTAPSRLHAKAEIVAAARSRVAPIEAALILAYSGQAADARAELDALPASDRREVYIAATEWMSQAGPDALARLDAVLRSDPQDWFAAAWAARIASLSDDPASLLHYSRWAIAVQGDSAPNVIRELSQVPAALDAPTANLPGNYPWAMYLRPVTPNLLTPQLFLIGGK